MQSWRLKLQAESDAQETQNEDKPGSSEDDGDTLDPFMAVLRDMVREWLGFSSTVGNEEHEAHDQRSVAHTQRTEGSSGHGRLGLQSPPQRDTLLPSAPAKSDSDDSALACSALQPSVPAESTMVAEAAAAAAAAVAAAAAAAAAPAAAAAAAAVAASAATTPRHARASVMTAPSFGRVAPSLSAADTPSSLPSTSRLL
eukprot:TRINITY_DN67363_c0_g1_i1.p2 TRINITY_DN67363_c0_g1~~TRINITY_DN67363_c0_g1_i1.p2  ORF type:complete len:199 (+),score=38.58 TRINITY_DN67363_c0_g1_i1:697-1293(+)